MTERDVFPVHPGDIETEAEFTAALKKMLDLRRRNLRALEADTKLSKTTLAELRSGRRRVSRDALTKIVGCYDPDRMTEWLMTWERVIEPATDLKVVETPARPQVVEPSLRTDMAASSPPSASATSTAEQDRQARPAVAWMLAAILAIETALFAGYWGTHRSSSSATLGTRDPSATSSTCVPSRLNYRPGVTALAGAEETGIRVGRAGYRLRAEVDPPRVEIAAPLTKPVPQDKRLFLVERGDPTTHDSTPEHHPGNGKYYPVSETHTDGLCVRMPENLWGYGDFYGISVRVFVVLVDANRASEFAADATDGLDGYTQGQFDSYEPVELAFFDVGSMEAP